MRAMTFSIPGHLPSRSNERVHWSKRSRLSRLQRQGAYLETRAAMPIKDPMKLPVTVTMTRVSVRRIDDDNLAGAFKSIRDGIADAFGVDDSPSGPITWRYARRGGASACAEITIEEGGHE